jgi:hypothetical protein
MPQMPHIGPHCSRFPAKRLSPSSSISSSSTGADLLESVIGYLGQNKAFYFPEGKIDQSENSLNENSLLETEL